MSIILVCPNLKFGGAEKNTVNLANEFCNKGLDVSIVLLKKEGALIKDVDPGIKIFSLDKSRSRYAIFAFANLFRERRKKVVISMLRESSLMVALSLFFIKTKPFFIIREACHFESTSSLYKKLISYLYSKADLFISNSTSTLNSFNDNQILKRVSTKVVYNPALPNNFFDQLNNDISHDWLDDRQITTLITGGRLEKEKNVDQVIEAFKLLSEKMDSLRLIVLGDGSQKNKLKDLITSLDLENKIDMIGFVDVPALLIQKADLFIMATENEGFGNLLVEAMGSGTKVLARNSGGPTEILKNGSIGFLGKFLTPEGLAQEIEEALDTPPDKNNLISRAKDFSVNVIINEYLGILKKFSKEIE